MRVSLYHRRGDWYSIHLLYGVWRYHVFDERNRFPRSLLCICHIGDRWPKETAEARYTYGCILQGHIYRQTHTTEGRGATPHILGVCTYDTLLTHLALQHIQQQKHRHRTTAAYIQSTGLWLHQWSISQAYPRHEHTRVTSHHITHTKQRYRHIWVATRTTQTHQRENRRDERITTSPEYHFKASEMRLWLLSWRPWGLRLQ